jgi:predicted transposase/invertase (TIGR01784 family)
MMSVSQSERERAIFRSRRMYQSDLDSNLKTAEDRGDARGVARVARNLKTLNIPINEIVEATGLSAAEIERL